MNEPTETTNISDSSARDIFTKHADVKRSSIRELHGETIVIEQSAATNVTATDMTARQSAMLQATVTNLTATSSALAYTQATNVNLNAGSQSVAVVAAGDTRMDQSAAQVLIADQVNEVKSSALGAVVANSVALRDSTVAILIARNIEGNVSPQLDTRGAIIAGAIAGAVLSVVFVATNLLTSRRRR